MKTTYRIISNSGNSHAGTYEKNRLRIQISSWCPDRHRRNHLPHLDHSHASIPNFSDSSTTCGAKTFHFTFQRHCLNPDVPGITSIENMLLDKPVYFGITNNDRSQSLALESYGPGFTTLRSTQPCKILIRSSSVVVCKTAAISRVHIFTYVARYVLMLNDHLNILRYW